MTKLIGHGVVSLFVLGAAAAVWGCGSDPTAWQKPAEEESVSEVQQSVVSGNWLVATGAAGLNTVTADGLLGTDLSSNYAVEIHVKGARALRLQPVASTSNGPNVIGGHPSNAALSGVHTSVVAGGGEAGLGGNELSDNYTTISGGASNRAGNQNADRSDAHGATVSGGNNSRAKAAWSTVGGGYNNETNGMGATVNGGMDNTASAAFSAIGGGSLGVASGNFSTVGGGQSNTASGQNASLGGGFSNTSSGVAASVSGGSQSQATKDYASVGGGLQNKAIGPYATVGGGSGNQAGSTTIANISYVTVSGGSANVATAWHTTISGGYSNDATFEFATVSGGADNMASGGAATVAGGQNNVASGTYSFAGGLSSSATAESAIALGRTALANQFGAVALGGINSKGTGIRAVAIGGSGNEASGTDSFAAGKNALANANNCFVWSDGSSAGTTTCIRPDGSGPAPNMFIVRASGGTTFYSSSSNLVGAKLDPGGGSFTSVSDRNVKTDVVPVDVQEVLERVTEMPMNTWSYITEQGVRHMGPMAQDFRAAFGLGTDERSIVTVDADGVALAAIQGLSKKVHALEAEAVFLKESLAKETALHREDVAALAAQNRDLAKRLDRLEASVPAKAGFGTDSGTAAMVVALGGLAFAISRRRSAQPAKKSG